MDESGFKDFEATVVWYGLMGSNRMPPVMVRA